MRSMTENQQVIVPPANARHHRFADVYMAGGSATQAAIECGYSIRTAGVQAAQLLKKEDVASYIRATKQQNSLETGVNANKWTRELAKSGFSNVMHYTRVNEDGDLEVDFSNATEDQLAAVQSVKVKKRKIYDKEGNTVGEEHQSEFRLWDKLRALELLGRQAGFLTETEHRVVIDVADRLLTARSRVMKESSSLNTLSLLDESEDDEATTTIEHEDRRSK